MKNKPEPLKIAHFRFALIAPVIQGLYPDASEAAYYRRVTQDPILRPDGVSYKYSPDTLERWTGLYRKKGMDGLIPGFRKDKGVSRALSADAINEIYRLREKFPRINGVMIHQMLIQSSFIDAKVSVRAVQRFLKENDLRSARNPAVKDRKAYEMPEFGCMWQADTAYLPYITENGRSRRTFLIMIIDDHSRLIVGGGIFYNDNAYNYQKVLKQAISTIPWALSNRMPLFEMGLQKGKLNGISGPSAAAGCRPLMSLLSIRWKSSTPCSLLTSVGTTPLSIPVQARLRSTASCVLRTMSASQGLPNGWMNALPTVSHAKSTMIPAFLLTAFGMMPLHSSSA